MSDEEPSTRTFEDVAQEDVEFQAAAAAEVFSASAEAAALQVNQWPRTQVSIPKIETATARNEP